MAGKTRRSLQELSAEVATNPGSTAFVELAAAYRERGDLQRALWLCLRGIQRHPTHVEAHYELGRIYWARGEREPALDEWNIVRQLAPDHLASRLALIELYMEEGRRADAERELEAAERLAEGDRVVAELRKRLSSVPQEKAKPAGGVFEPLAEEEPGTLGVLLVDGDGRVMVGRIRQQGVETDMALAANLNSARAEAERVASYLGLGEVVDMEIESNTARLTVSPVGDEMIVLATSLEVPAGQASRLAQRAWNVAQSYLDSRQTKGGDET